MKYNVNCHLVYDIVSPTTFILNIQAAKTNIQHIEKELFIFDKSIIYEILKINTTETRFLKFHSEKHTMIEIKYQFEAQVSPKQFTLEDLSIDIPIIDLPHETYAYLSPSRHCESDKLYNFAHKHFGNQRTNIEKIIAINSWIVKNIDYSPGYTTASTSATDTIISRIGVCKDFAHLGIALCRAIDIPARYFTAYAFNLYPADIHACYEVYINGNWIVFDPTNLSNTKHLVKISHGKDASEIAVASYFGSANCAEMNVNCSLLHDSSPMNKELFYSYS